MSGRRENERLGAPVNSSREQSRHVPLKNSAELIAPVAGLLLLTLVLRITVIVVDGDRLHSDPDAYLRLATMLAEGKGFTAADGIRPTAFRPVLYPLLIAGPLALGISATVSVVFWNLLAGLLLIVAVVQLASEFELNRTGILVAGCMAAVDPLLIRYTTEPMTENVCAALFAFSVVYLLRFFRSAGACDAPADLATGVKAGLLLGLSALCRPIVLISCLLLTLTMSILRWKSGDRRPTAGARRVVWISIPAVVCTVTVSPWVIRNALQFGTLVPATTHGGYTLLLGNNSEFFDRVVSGQQSVWDEGSLKSWQHSLQQRLNHDRIDLSDEPAVDQWMYREARKEMSTRPLAAVRAVVLRWRRFWSLTPTASGNSLPSWMIHAVGTCYALLGIGLLASLFRLHRNSAVLLLWMSVASFVVVHSFYWTNTRMRAPLTGVLVLLAVTGWSALLHRKWEVAGR